MRGGCDDVRPFDHSATSPGLPAVSNEQTTSAEGRDRDTAAAADQTSGWRPLEPIQHYESDGIWRQMAGTHLDCIVRIVAERLTPQVASRNHDDPSASKGESDSPLVTVFRHDLEQLRSFAEIARDAAYRIGR